MKKITVLTAGILCASGIAIGACASGVIEKVQAELRPDFTVKIDGDTKTFKNVNGDVVYPLLYEGTTYLPVRAIGEIMGKTVYWYEDQKLVELKGNTTTVTDADVIVPSGSQTPQPTVSPDTTQGEISLDKAKNIALEKAGLSANEVIFTEAKRDFEHEKWIYEIEFVKDNTEYSAEILASDGSIIKWETEHDNHH